MWFTDNTEDKGCGDRAMIVRTLSLSLLLGAAEYAPHAA